MTLRLFGLKVEPLPPTLARLPCGIPHPCPQLPVGHLESICLLQLSLFPGLLALGTAPAQSFRWESPRHLGGDPLRSDEPQQKYLLIDLPGPLRLPLLGAGMTPSSDGAVGHPELEDSG